MNLEAALESLAGWGRDDWLGLWEIANYVADELGVEDDGQQLEVTIALVRGLLERGFRAGDSPLQNTEAEFVPWRNQDIDTVAALIRREWNRNEEFPCWGDAPWFATARLCRLDA